MRKLPALFLLALVTLVSCQKETSGRPTSDDFYVSFFANGVKKTYTTFAAAHRDSENGHATLKIVGNSSLTTFTDVMGFYIGNYQGSADIAAGEYEDISPNFLLLSTYENGGKTYEAGETLALEAISSGATIANHLKLKITSINNETARGTFSGDYYTDADAKNGTKLSITGGEFYVKIQ
jgi:hypothetical protein